MAHILVVEDDEELAEMVRKLLHTQGHTVVIAPDGELGLVAVKRDRPDLVILDLNLPKVDGHTVCQTLKADASTKKIPIVMMTAAYADRADAERGLALGADEYIIKPFNAQVFLYNIQRLLDAKKRPSPA